MKIASRIVQFFNVIICVLDSCVVSASMYSLESVALSEQKQRRLQVCKNNWLRRNTGVKRVERRRMKDLREEV